MVERHNSPFLRDLGWFGGKKGFKRDIEIQDCYNNKLTTEDDSTLVVDFWLFSASVSQTMDSLSAYFIDSGSQQFDEGCGRPFPQDQHWVEKSQPLDAQPRF